MPDFQLVPVDHDPWASAPQSGAQQWQSAIAANAQRQAQAPSMGQQIMDIAGNTGSMLAAPLMAGPRLMGDVASGAVDPNSPEAIRRSADVALNTAGMGSLGAERAGASTVGTMMSAPLFHGSPVAGLETIKPSVRGPLGPGVYTTPAEQIAGSYARMGEGGGAGTLYNLPDKPRDIFLGHGHRTDEEWFGFKNDKQRLIEAAEPEKKEAVSDILDKMWSNDGYPAYQRIMKLYGGDEKAQQLFKKAGFEGVSGLVDGPEVLLFNEQRLKPYPSITAYHGSPHDFDRFDFSKIGTGEGAQAYGHGGYFAEKEGTAKAYREALKDRSFQSKEGLVPYGQAFSDIQDAAQRAGNLHRDHSYQLANTIMDKIERGADLHDIEYPVERFDNAYKAGVAHAEERGFAPNPGRMYQVAINASPEHFLDWDKPLSEQSDHVRNALKGVVDERNSGSDVHDALVNIHGSDAAATEALRKAGIPGIRYLDQGSRGTFDLLDLQRSRAYWEKNPGPEATQRIQEIDRAIEEEKNKPRTRNYVVFDDRMVDILKKYGMTGLSALPAAGAYHFRTQPVDHDPFATNSPKHRP